MRCPKCQYVGFEPSPRCKNCGYDLSLAQDDAPGLAISNAPEFEGPLADLDLHMLDDVPPRVASASTFDLDDLLANGPSGHEPRRVAARSESRQASKTSVSAVATPPADAMRAYAAPAPAPVARASERPAPVAAPAPVTTELPLFMRAAPESAEAPAVPAADPILATIPDLPAIVHSDAGLDAVPAQANAVEIVETEIVGAGIDVVDVVDEPLVKVPAVPRAPLAVRRATPDPARLRAKYGKAARTADAAPIESTGDLLEMSDIAADVRELELEFNAATPARRLAVEPARLSLPEEWVLGASPAKRMLAAAVDGALLLSINAAVVWFALAVSGLAANQASLLPAAPLLLFFLLLDAGYLVLFTAACGQTIGKMAAGIRVVGTSTGAVLNDRVSIAQAITRAFGAIASIVPLGAGFVPGLVGERRAAHDRLAHTRVVSA